MLLEQRWQLFQFWLSAAAAQGLLSFTLLHGSTDLQVCRVR